MSEMSEYFSLMHHLNMEFNQECSVGKDIVQEKTFFALQNSFNCWSEVTGNNIKHIDKHFSKFFDYWSCELGNLKEVKFFIIFQMVKTRNIVASEYYKHKKELSDKKAMIIKAETPE